MNSGMIVTVLRMILCNDAMTKWMKEQAEKTDTPIDNYMIDIINYLLCSNTESKSWN